MKKIFLTLGLAAACLTSNAFERVLYQQNFETVSTPEAAGWSFGGEKMTLASDFEGKYLDLSLGQSNGRSGQVVWGDSIYMDKDGQLILEDNRYKMEFSFCINTMPNNQFNSEITVFTNHMPIANNLYRLPWSDTGKPAHQKGVWENFIFDLSQCNTAVESDMLAAINAPLIVTEGDSTAYGINNYTLDTAEAKTLGTGTWYTATMDVDIQTRVVEYSVMDVFEDELTSGTMTVPENDINGDPISMFAQGIFALLARYQASFLFDNIKISCEVKDPYANVPTVALTRLGQNANDEQDLNVRAYTITFADGETLHVKGTDGKTIDVEWADCEGAYVYETTTSGVLEAWTTCEGATSEIATEKVDCSPCKLPSVTATITSVEAGFGKTYTLTISNADVPLRPTIFIDYEFTGVNGEKLTGSDAASGAKVTVTQEGTLKLISKAFGYESTESSVDNNIEFEIKNKWDFARMTDEEITKAGFPAYQELNSGSTSGFTNWTGRKRLFYYDAATESVNDEGETVYDAVYPFGFVSEDSPNLIYYSELDAEGEVATNVAGYELFPGITVYAGHNVTYMKHIGMINNATTGGNNKNIDVLDLDATDFVVIDKINNYGGNSNHPVCKTVDEYYEVLCGESEVYSASINGTLNEETGKYTVSCPVYRIDTAATCVTVFKKVGGGDDDAVDTINAVNGDGFWYSIDGIRVAEPTRPGLYIHNGKKIIVK